MRTSPSPAGLLRAGAAAGLGALLLLPAAAAQAHVRVHADSTASGSFSALTFRVPNESATAGTVGVSVQLPQDTPFLYVSSKPVPGWTVATREEALPRPVTAEGTTLTKAVRTVTWTAQKGTAIGPGEYQEFSLSVGPLPSAGTILLPATQTYSDGEVVRWDQPTPAGGDEPEHPAPALVVTAAGAAAGSTSSTSAAPTAVPSAGQSSAEGGSGEGASAARPDGVARGLGAAGLVLGAVALVVALLAARRRRGAAA